MVSPRVEGGFKDHFRGGLVRGSDVVQAASAGLLFNVEVIMQAELCLKFTLAWRQAGPQAVLTSVMHERSNASQPHQRSEAG